MRSFLSQLLEHHNKILEELEKSNNVDVFYLDFPKAFDKGNHGILLNKKSKLMLKSVCEYTIFYQTDSNVLPSMEQHQVKLKSEVAYTKDQCWGPSRS